MENIMSKLLPKRKELKRLFSYNPETGQFIRKVRTSPRGQVGDVAGTTDANGYINIRVNGTSYRAHRLAFAYIYGRKRLTHYHIDHINGVKDDNRITNLRRVTTRENAYKYMDVLTDASDTYIVLSQGTDEIELLDVYSGEFFDFPYDSKPFKALKYLKHLDHTVMSKLVNKTEVDYDLYQDVYPNLKAIKRYVKRVLKHNRKESLHHIADKVGV